MKPAKHPACTRHFRTKLTPAEIHDRLRLPQIRLMPFLYILTEAKPDRLILSPRRVEERWMKNSFAGELILNISPAESGSEVELQLIPQPWAVGFFLLYCGFCALIGVLSLLLLAHGGLTGDTPLPLLIPWLMMIFAFAFYKLGYRFAAISLEGKLKKILDVLR